MDAYAVLVRAHEPAARRLSYLLCGSDSDDAVQEAIVKGWYSIDRYREEAPFGAWLLRIVANQAHNRRRAAGRRASYELRAVDDRIVPSPESSVLDVERRRALLDAVSSLSPKLRDVVACRHLLDLSEAETAQVLGIPPGTVKSRLARGLGRLRSVVEVDRD